MSASDQKPGFLRKTWECSWIGRGGWHFRSLTCNNAETRLAQYWAVTDKETTLSKVENWLNRHFMTMFVKTVNSRHPADNTDLRKNLGYFCDLDLLQLDDGKVLGTSGTALFKILQFLDMAGDRSIETLDDLTRGLHALLLPAWQKKISESNQELLNEFFRMRATGEWAEWDRLALHILGESMGDFVDKQAALIRYSEDDPEAGGEQLFTVEFSHSSKTGQIVAFGSTPEYALAHFEDIMLIAGEGLKTAPNIGHGDLLIRKNFKWIAEIPLKVDYLLSENEWTGELSAVTLSKPDALPQWGKIDWLVQDKAVMKALVDVAPDDSKSLIKGGFLENDLGM